MIRMQHLTLSLFVSLIAVSTIPFVLSYETSTGTMNQPLGDFTMPDWIKNTAGWWAEEQIDDESFVLSIQWLITNDVIILPPTDQGVNDGENVIPNWIKNTARWWAGDQIPDITFVSSIKYLINEGIMIVMDPKVEEEKCNFKGFQVVCSDVKEVEEIKEFHMAVNDYDCALCLNWGYVGEKYYFQINTFDEYRGDSLDGVTINAEIISKDGELRHNFGVLTTEDGIYSNYIIPGTEWFGDNILSVTGEYKGIEKTVEKEFDVFMPKPTFKGQGTFSAKFLSPINATSDGNNSFTELKGAHSVDTFTIDNNTYAIVTGMSDDGVQIIDLTGITESGGGFPFSGIMARDAETDGANSFTELNGARNVATYTIASATKALLSLTSANYAIVAGLADNGLQVIDVGIPTAIVAKDAETDGANGFDKIEGVYGIATFGIPSNSTYRGAVITGNTDDSVMTVDITNPTAIFEHDVEIDGANSFTELDGPRGVAVWNSTDNTYAIVVSQSGNGVQIVDITDPSAMVAKDAETDDENGFTELEGAHGVATWFGTNSSNVYAIVASVADDGVQVMDISDPTNIKALDAETDGVNGFTELDGAAGVSTFTCGNSKYAIVSSNVDDGIQLIDVSVPSSIKAVTAETDGKNGFTELDGARNVSTITIGGNQYAIVTAQADDGVQIVKVSCNRN